MTYILITDFYSRYSYRKYEFEQLIQLGSRDPETGYLTNAGYIPLISSITKYVTALLPAFDATQSTVRTVLNHDMVLTAWYPLDVSASPAYKIANFTQVMLKHLYSSNLNAFKTL
jgi:hypothetical protein